jgi:hypothetical protein
MCSEISKNVIQTLPVVFFTQCVSWQLRDASLGANQTRSKLSDNEKRKYESNLMLLASWLCNLLRLLRLHTYMHTHIHTYKHTYTHTYIHTYIRTNIHTYTHTFTKICNVKLEKIIIKLVSCKRQLIFPHRCYNLRYKICLLFNDDHYDKDVDNNEK